MDMVIIYFLIPVVIGCVIFFLGYQLIRKRDKFVKFFNKNQNTINIQVKIVKFLGIILTVIGAAIACYGIVISLAALFLLVFFNYMIPEG